MMAIVGWQWYDGNACGRDEQSACPAPPASFSAAPPICQLGAVGKAATIAPGLTKFFLTIVKTFHLLQPLVEDYQLAIEGGRQSPLFWKARHLFAAHFPRSTECPAK